MQRIWALLQDTPGFDTSELVPILASLLVRPEAQQLGLRVAGGLVQRTAARLIREWLVPNTAKAERSDSVLHARPSVGL